MSWETLDNTDWLAGMLMSTAMFAYYTERRTGNVVWRTDETGGKRLSLAGLRSFMMAPFRKIEMWKPELLDQNFVISTGLTAPLFATLSGMCRHASS